MGKPFEHVLTRNSHIKVILIRDMPFSYMMIDEDIASGKLARKNATMRA